MAAVDNAGHEQRWVYTRKDGNVIGSRLQWRSRPVLPVTALGLTVPLGPWSAWQDTDVVYEDL